MTKDEALKLALKALESLMIEQGSIYDQAITAIKEALAEPEPNYKKALEVWLDKTELVQKTVKLHELGMHRADVLKQRIQEVSLQRTWVGLTDEDFLEACQIAERGNYLVAFQRIQAKIKEKNT